MAIKGARGFAAMDPAKQREIASKGGKASHQKGTAHEFTPEEAREAGRKGGKISHQRGTAHRFTSEEARAAGRKGGERSRGKNRQAANANTGQESTATAEPPRTDMHHGEMHHPEMHHPHEGILEPEVRPMCNPEFGNQNAEAARMRQHEPVV